MKGSFLPLIPQAQVGFHLIIFDQLCYTLKKGPSKFVLSGCDQGERG